MSRLPKEYIGLMRDALNGDPNTNRPLKRRKKNTSREHTPNHEPTVDIVDLEPETPERTTPVAANARNAIEVIDLENDDGETPEVVVADQDDSDATMNKTVTEFDDDDDDDDSDDDDDEFEEIDLVNVKPRASNNLTSDVLVSYDKDKTEPAKPKKKLNIIDREERLFRRNFHRNHVAIMLIHGSIRNEWCNNKPLQNHLVKLVKPSVYTELHPPKEVELPQNRTRKFLDGLRHLMERWCKYYKVTSNKGIHRHDWYDWSDFDRSKTDFARFSRCLTKGRGTRDIGAQGFVVLLRAAGVPSRLVYSLQPPDFTTKQIKEKKQLSTAPSKSAALSIHQKVLALRKGNTQIASSAPTQAEVETKYPVFWAEAWDSASKTWITIDPIMLRVIENVKYKSQLEPPSQHPYNNLLYVIGYDRKGGVRDITKRYTEKFYAKTRKKRLTKDLPEEIWFEAVLNALSKRGRNKSDDYEDEYFVKKAAKEGMPDNIQDFKNHPFYVLEMHLKSTEVLYPKEPCGTVRIRNKNETIPVYKRGNVQALKSPRGWFHVGRTLKNGERALKTKLKNPNQMREDDDDREERLYAEYQTQLYVPPPVVDGQITKNAFGNIDVYVPSMIPAGGALLTSTYAEDASKAIGIDYATAVVGFKFDRRQITPKFGGVVIAEEYKEAVEAVQEQLKNEALEKERLDLEIRALKGWDLLLTKLRIKNRLNKTHGKVNEKSSEGKDSEDELEKLEDEYEKYVHDEDQDDDSDVDDDIGGSSKEPAIGFGGFLPEDADFEEQEERFDTGAGFLAESDAEPTDTSAGFIPEDEEFDPYDVGPAHDSENSDTRGGFILEENDDSSPEVERPQDADDELDEFETFFDGLENYNEGYDSDEPMISVDEAPLKASKATSPEIIKKSTVYEVNKSNVPESDPLGTVDDDLEEQDPQDFGFGAPDTNATSENKDRQEHRNTIIIKESHQGVQPEPTKEDAYTIIVEESFGSTQGPPNIPLIPNDPSFDEELDKEFNEQLKHEKETQSGQKEADLGDSDDEEGNFDFEYESD